MSKNIVIKAVGISKSYVIGKESFSTLRDKISTLPKNLFRKKVRLQKFWALKDINFNIAEGDVVGIVGRNGAGKSTLLKILARITEPTSGRIEIHGRIASMLEVGTGFNPELTGRENIYLNGSIIGMTRSEIGAKFQDIVDFSGVEKFLDTPVKHYSSGMYVRLAFAVAAHLDADILLVDEVLAVGDLDFQKKCLEKIDSLSSSGKTVIFVSHNLVSVDNLCNKSIYLDGGGIIAVGDTKSVLKKYLSTHITNKVIKYKKNLSNKAQIISVNLKSHSENESIEYVNPIDFMVKIEIYSENIRLYLGIEILNEMNQVILFQRDFESETSLVEPRKKGLQIYDVSIPGHTLVPGTYQLRMTLADFARRSLIDMPSETLFFEVYDTTSFRKKYNFPWHGLTSTPISIKLKE